MSRDTELVTEELLTPQTGLPSFILQAWEIFNSLNVNTCEMFTCMIRKSTLEDVLSLKISTKEPLEQVNMDIFILSSTSEYGHFLSSVKSIKACNYAVVLLTVTPDTDGCIL
jgi:hypothetical protein